MKRFLYFLPSVAWAILIYSLSTTSAVLLPKFDLLSPDKIGHFTFYAVLTYWLLWGYAPQASARPKIFISLAWGAMASAYGILLEFVQASLPHRSFDYADMIANCIGALVGIYTYNTVLRTIHQAIRYANTRQR